MRAQLATRACEIEQARKTARLRSEVAAMRPEDDADFRAGFVVHSFETAAAELRLLPDAELRAVMGQLSRALRLTNGRLFQVRASR